MSVSFLHFSKTTTSSTLLFSATIFHTPFLRSPLNTTFAKTFSSLLFQLLYLLLQSETTRSNQSYFPILLTMPSYLFTDFMNPCISNSSSKPSLQSLSRNFIPTFTTVFSPECSFLRACNFFVLPMSVSSYSY